MGEIHEYYLSFLDGLVNTMNLQVRLEGNILPRILKQWEAQSGMVIKNTTT